LETDPDRVTEIWKKELEIAAKKMMAHGLMGTEPSKKKFNISIEIADPIANALIQSCHGTGMDINEIIGSMASQGLKNMMATKLEAFQEPAPKQEPTAQIPGMPQLDQIGQMTGQMTKLAELMSNVSSTVDTLNTAAETDNQQPDVPDRKVAQGTPK